MRGELEAITAAGGELVFIGSGTPAMAADFAEHHAAGCTVLTDPTLAAQRRMGLKRGVASTLGLRSAVSAIFATLNGHFQSRTAGDPWQQGGVFVVDRAGTIVYEQRNEDAGERPDRQALLDALREAVRTSNKA